MGWYPKQKYRDWPWIRVGLLLLLDERREEKTKERFNRF